MKVKTYSNIIGFVPNSFILEIDSYSIKSKFVATVYNNNNLEIHFSDDLTAQEQADCDTIVQNHNSSLYSEPKIFDYLVDKGKPLHSIDHNIDLTITPRKKEVYGTTLAEKGLLKKKEYYSDDAFSDLLFYIDYDYQKDAFGYLTHQSVKLTWINKDNQDNSLIKDKGFNQLSPSESRIATRKRRESVVYMLESSLIELLMAAPGGAENLQTGAEFMAAASPSIEKFYNSGLPDDVAAFVNDSGTQATYPFLLMEVTPGYTVAQFIIDGVTYE